VVIVYGTNRIVVDRKQGCFSGMKRSVSGLVGRQEVECRTVGSEAPSDGDKVRITRKKGTFEKEYTSRWTEEVFTVSDVRYTDPTTCKIVDYNKEEIKGSFYEPELRKASQEMFRIEKVIRRKGNKYLVKWLGYTDSFNSWVDNDELVKL